MTIMLRALNSECGPQICDDDRLAELHAVAILDTAAEARFDRYTELATCSFKAPIALIGFVDQSREWIKSARGFEVREIAREDSFSARALFEVDGVLVVKDALGDARFDTNPLVLHEPRIRFYAGAVLRGPCGQPLGTLCVMDHRPREFSAADINALRLMARMTEEELLRPSEDHDGHEVLRDPNTGLPNFGAFMTTMRNSIGVAGGEMSLLLALVRIERFDSLYAALGTSGAALLMTQMAKRIRDCMPTSAFIGQTREDKLAVLVPTTDAAVSQGLLERLLTCTREAFLLDEHAVRLTISVGASSFPEDAVDAESLLKRARTALWSKPLSEQSEYRCYRRDQSDDASRLFEMQSALRKALLHEEFRLVYQPKVNLASNTLVGAEALLRWTSSDLGKEVSPAIFIPIAESSGIIGEIGSWVLKAACEQMQAWQEAGTPCPCMGVNITSHQLRQAGFADEIKMLMQAHPAALGRLNLELTEGSLVEDIEGAVRIMHVLCTLGATFSIDDFGTGFSSLSYLRSMPVEVLKIDRSFVMNVPAKVEDNRLVRSIISMGHDLGMVVIAEGVETPQQLEFLRVAGCDQVQGYIFSRPVAAAEFRQAWLGPDRQVIWSKTGKRPGPGSGMRVQPLPTSLRAPAPRPAANVRHLKINH
jgi:EAL domain-containing protein (putative c-di-GMP-specific phosphodiesterase class I)/GGDEF domain-containing protein